MDKEVKKLNDEYNEAMKKEAELNPGVNINNTEIESTQKGSIIGSMLKNSLEGSIRVGKDYKYEPTANPNGSNASTSSASNRQNMLNNPVLTPMSQ